MSRMSANSTIIHDHLPQIREFCERWQITELSVFGSAARGDMRPDSDVDLLVAFAEEADWGLLEVFEMEDEAAKILGRKVDLVSRRGVEEGGNWIIQREILGTAKPVYENTGSLPA